MNTEVQLLIIKGVISDLKPEDQRHVKDCKRAIRNAMAAYPEEAGSLALLVVFLESKKHDQ